MADSNYLERFTLKHNPLTASLMKAVFWPLSRQTKAYIFVATTGRSGTASLERILSRLDRCISFHECYPIMHDRMMQALNNRQPAAARNTYDFVKTINIRRAALGHKYYAETNHMFIKSFADSAARDLGKKLKVIHLIRDPVAVARSITMLNHYPGTEMGNRWYLDYRAPGNLIQITDMLDTGDRFTHPFFKSLWYWYEIEARVEQWHMRHGHIAMYTFKTEDLNDEKKLCALFDHMGIDYDSQAVARVASTRENQKLSLKTKGSGEIGNTESMHELFKEMLCVKGYHLPATLSLFR